MQLHAKKFKSSGDPLYFEKKNPPAATADSLTANSGCGTHGIENARFLTGTLSDTTRNNGLQKIMSGGHYMIEFSPKNMKKALLGTF